MGNGATWRVDGRMVISAEKKNEEDIFYESHFIKI